MIKLSFQKLILLITSTILLLQQTHSQVPPQGQQQQPKVQCLPPTVLQNQIVSNSSTCTNTKALNSGCVTCKVDISQNDLQCSTCQANMVPLRDQLKCVYFEQQDPMTPPTSIYSQVYDQTTQCQNIVLCSPLCTECTNSLLQTQTNQSCLSCIPPFYPLLEMCVIDCQFQMYNNTGLYGYQFLLLQQQTQLVRSTTTCIPCPQYCLTCTYISASLLQQPNAVLRCNECIYSKQRYANQKTENHFLKTKNNTTPPMTPGYTCKTAANRLTTTLSLKYIVSPNGANTCTEPCASTIVSATPSTYFTFKKMVNDLTMQNINQYKEIVVDVFFVKNAAGSKLFFLDQNMFSGDSQNWMLRVFERSSATVTMQPCDSSNNCVNVPSALLFDVANDEKPIVVWRNHFLFFHVTKAMLVQNIVFRGGDLILDTAQQTANTEICAAMNMANGCRPTNLKFNQNNYFSTDPVQPMWSRPEGLFRLDWLVDYDAASIPTLTIENCEFSNFVAHKYAKSLISFGQAGYITVNNVTFNNNFFRYGLITNSLQEEADRQGFQMQDGMYNHRTQHLYSSTSQTEKTCKSFGHTYSSSTFCHKIEVKNSLFEKYNSYMMDKNQLPVFEEGMALSLQNVQGPIVIKNNSFSKFITFQNHEYSQATNHQGTYNCAKETLFPHFNVQQSDVIYDGYNDVTATSMYKLYIDKHIRKFLNFKREIGSVLHLKNVTFGLILFNNTFDSNVGTGGTNLLLEGFRNAITYPIVLERNVFSNNFAYQFAPSFAIVTNEPDLIDTLQQCTGVFINENRIFGNAGCNHAFSNAVVSCEPNHPNVVPPAMINQDSVKNLYNSKDEESYYRLYTFVLLEPLVQIKDPQNSPTPEQSKFDQWLDNQVARQDTTLYNPVDNPDNFTDYSSFYDSDNAQAIPNFRATVKSNECFNNYVILSNCFYLQGFEDILFQNNTLYDNSVPIVEIMNTANYIPNNAFYTLIAPKVAGNILFATEQRNGNTKQTYAKESSPLMIRLSQRIVVKDCIFKNNSAVFTGDFYFGQAITIDKAIGIKNITIDNCTFLNHSGLSEQIQPIHNEAFIDHFCSFPLVSYSFWLTPNFNAFQVNIAFKKFSPTLEIVNCEIKNNTFNLKNKLPNGAYKGEEMRFYQEQELLNDVWIRQPNLQSNQRFTLKYERMNQFENYRDYSSFLFKFFLPQDTNFDKGNEKVSQMVSQGDGSNQINSIRLHLENITISNNLNQAGTCFLEGGINDFIAKNVSIFDNEVASTCSLFSDKIKNFAKDYLDNDYLLGGIICFQEPNNINSQSDQNITIYNVTINNNKGIVFKSYNHNTAKFQNKKFLIKDVLVTNNIALNTPLISIINSYDIEFNNVSIIKNTYDFGAFFFYQEESNILMLVLNNVTIENNIGTKILGIFSYQSWLLITDFVFQNNAFSTDLTLSNYQQISQTTLSKGMGTIQPVSIGMQMWTYSNIIFQNFKMSQNYASIPGFYLSNCYLSLYNIEFENITSPVGISPILQVTQQSVLLVDHASISNITCEKCIGGVMISVNSKITLEKVLIKNIQSYSSGIGVFNASTVEIYKSSFSHIKVEKTCSCIDSKLGSLKIQYNEFSDNSALDMTISVSSTDFYAKDCVFARNKGQLRTKNIYGKDIEKNFNIDNITFIDYLSDNTNAPSSFIYGIDIYAKIENCRFLGAYSQLGAIYIDSLENQIIINNSQFNDALVYGQEGGGGLNAKTVVTIDNSSFFNNSNVLLGSEQSSCLQIDSSNALTITNSNFSDSNNYYLVIENTKLIYLDNLVFSSSQNLSNVNNNGAIFVTGCPQFNFTNSVITGLKGQKCGGGVKMYFEVSQSFGITQLQYDIFNLTILNSTATNGGALCIQNTDQTIPLKMNIQNSTFVNNKAEYGGAIYYDCQKISCVTLVNSSNFEKNQAVYGGGAIYFTGFNVYYDKQCSFLNNSAFYGPHIGAYPIRMQLVTTNTTNVNQTEITQLFKYVESTTITTERLRIMKESKGNHEKKFNNNQSQQQDRRMLVVPEQNIIVENTTKIENQLVSGQVTLNPPIFILVDEFGQHVNTLNESYLTISSPNQNLKITSQNSYRAINGTYIAYPLIVQFSPGQSVEFAFETDGIKEVPGRTFENLTSLQMEYNFTGYLRMCVENEQWTDYDSCEVCKSGYMNTQPTVRGLSCQKCPASSACLGDGLVGPNKGYWRLNSQSSNFLECENPDSCLGTWANQTAEEAHDLNLTIFYCKDGANDDQATFCLNGWCAAKYKGNMCASCQDGFAKSNKIYCVSCSDNPLYYVIIGLVFLAALLFVIITIRDTLKEKKYEPGEVQYNRSSVLMKIILNYFQLIAIVATFDFKWPSEVKATLNAQQQVTAQTAEVFSFDCFLNSKASSTTNGELTSFFVKLLIISICPIVFSLVAMIVWLVIFLFRYKISISKYFNILKSNIITSVIIILFLLHTTIVETTIRSLRCKNLADESLPVTYMYEDYEVECWVGTHLKWVFLSSLPSLGLWGLAAPILAFLVLFRNTEKFDQEDFKRSYGFLYLGYSKPKYYWELVILYRKLAMIFISVFMSTFSVYVQAVCVLGVGFISYLAQVNNHPFIEEDLNNIETKSLISATFTLYCGLFYLSGDLDENSSYVLFILILSSNIIFGLLWAQAYLQEILLKFRQSKFVEKYFSKKHNEKQLSDDHKKGQMDAKGSYRQLVQPKNEEQSHIHINNKDDTFFEQQAQQGDLEKHSQKPSEDLLSNDKEKLQQLNKQAGQLQVIEKKQDTENTQQNNDNDNDIQEIKLDK